MSDTALNIAVVGTGISGLSAAWLLSQRHRVTVFEKESRLGGHSHTVDVRLRGAEIPVDTGFIVFNDRCYPNLVALFKHLGINTHKTDMSFSASLDNGRLEYSGSSSIATLFAQKRNLLRPRFWGMLRDLLRFYRQSPQWMQTLPDTVTLGELLKREGFGDGFRDDHLLPMGAAIWSTPVQQMLDYPAKAFLQFCDNHGLLQVEGRPQWQSVVGGSREYVERISKPFAGGVQLNCGVTRIQRHATGATLQDDNGKLWQFDHVVLACHADQALAILGDPSPEERRLLGAFRYEHNRAVLHSDPALMPRRRKAWASWNYLGQRNGPATDKVSVSYWMNQLQNLPTSDPLLVTLNPLVEPRRHLVHGSFDYQHPIFDPGAILARQSLWGLQGVRRSWFCGSYFGHGFHEDGLQSGLAAAEQLGGLQRPWQVNDANGRIHVTAATSPVRDAA